MELQEILNRIPNYKEFMTIAELDGSSKKLAQSFDHVNLKEIGKSRGGRTIYCLKIGEGKKNALLFAFPHPNEPIGSMSLEFLSHFLAKNPEFTKKTGYTWYLINSGFGGVYFYVSRSIGNLFENLVKLVKREHLPLHLGEPEAPYIKKLHDGVFQMFGVQKQYDYIEAKGIENPQDFITFGTSSYDYLKSIVGEESFTLVCEMPYFYHNSIGDTTLTEFQRRDLRMQSLEYMKNISLHAKKIFRHIKKFCNKSSRIYTAVEGYIRITRPSLELEINVTKTSSMYDGKATVSQAFDLNISSRYYKLLIISMIVRLCEEAISIHPGKEIEIKKIKNDLEKWIEQKINELLSSIKYDVIPIQKLVRVQIGSAFITLENLSKKP